MTLTYVHIAYIKGKSTSTNHVLIYSPVVVDRGKENEFQLEIISWLCRAIMSDKKDFYRKKSYVFFHTTLQCLRHVIKVLPWTQDVNYIWITRSMDVLGIF